MKRVGINARELSQRANVGRSFIYDILNGKSTNPTTRKIAAVADVLGVSVPYLVNGSCNDNEVTIGHGTSQVAVPEISSMFFSQNDMKRDGDSGSIYFFRKSLLRNFTLNIEDARVFKIEGDCMSPTLLDGDIVLVDLKQTEPNLPGVFLIYENKGLMAKRIEALPSSFGGVSKLSVSSDNKIYTSYSCNTSEVNIIGRVVWFSRRFV
jgi:phage repressor protein C with HTH and peptisase S24 domain